MSFTLFSPAKINLFLEVLRQRNDGFHEIQTVMHAISLYDRLVFKPLKTNPIRVKTLPPVVSEKDNLVFQIASRVQKHCQVQKGISITLHKRIPLGSGLGGGSSNAAFTLLGLNHLWSLGLKEKEMAELLASVSSDAPFFLRGGTQLATGRGEKVRPLSCAPRLHFLIVCPPLVCLTQDIYGSLRMKKNKNPLSYRRLFPRGKKHTFHPQAIFNRLQAVAEKRYPLLSQWLNQLETMNPQKIFMTGSGSALVLLFESPDSRTESFLKWKRLHPAWAHPFRFYEVSSVPRWMCPLRHENEFSPQRHKGTKIIK